MGTNIKTLNLDSNLSGSFKRGCAWINGQYTPIEEAAMIDAELVKQQEENKRLKEAEQVAKNMAASSRFTCIKGKNE